jgi:MFS superfamily sulfate permease-like transporter
LTRSPADRWVSHPVEPNLLAAPGIVVYRFEADLFYANTGRFTEEVLKLVNEASLPLRWVVIDATEISNIDYTAAKTLIQLGRELDQRGVGVAAVALPTGVRREIEGYKALHAQGVHREIFVTVDAAIDALGELSPPAPASSPNAKPE